MNVADITVERLKALPDLKLLLEAVPVMRGWEFRAPSSLRVKFSV